jgi:acid stress chaperone HdeB
MLRLTVILTLALVMVMPVCADAKKQVKEQVDMSKYTCGDLLSEDGDDIGTVLIWIDGYLSGKTGDTTIDLDFISKLAEGVGEACGSNKNAKVLNVVEKLVKH